MKLNPGVTVRRPAARRRGGQGESPLAAVMLKVAGASAVELIFNADRSRLVAVLLHEPVSPSTVQLCYALANAAGDSNWRADTRLPRRWKCWAVLSAMTWAYAQWDTEAERPTGVRVSFH